ncbi:hypothetical protein HDU84_004755, partial [Entophlyctis sp. JEL0112]
MVPTTFFYIRYGLSFAVALVIIALAIWMCYRNYRQSRNTQAVPLSQTVYAQPGQPVLPMYAPAAQYSSQYPAPYPDDPKYPAFSQQALSAPGLAFPPPAAAVDVSGQRPAGR